MTKTKVHHPPVPIPINTGIALLEVRIRNFRCLKSVNVALDPLTVLIGENNSGKTSFLNALHASIGAGQRTLSDEDIFLANGESKLPQDRSIIIDILIRPTDEKGKIAGTFPSGSPWLELWGNGVIQDDDGCDLVAIRTQLKWNTLRKEYVVDRRFLKEWNPDPAQAEATKALDNIGAVTTAQVEPLSLYFLDAKRDISDDFRNRSSFWYKMISDPGLSESDIQSIESELTTINEMIVNGSAVFSHVQDCLSGFHDTLGCEKNGITVTPLARQIRDLGRGVDVILCTKGAPGFPLHHQGMGTRSIATVLSFEAYMTWKQMRTGKGAIHPLAAVEEPESHLHPHAQRALFRRLSKMPGQRIVSTHSPFISGQAHIGTIRHFLKNGEQTQISRLDVSDLSDEDIRKINRHVMNTRGEILFARSLILFEGETEEQALPDFAERFWQQHPSELGISLVSVDGHGNYLPFLRLACTFSIPWHIFSDGEPLTVTSVNKALKTLGEKEIPNNPRVVVLPNGQNFEQYLVSCHKTDVINMIVHNRAKNEKHRNALLKEWSGKNDADLIQELSNLKTQYGSRVGKLFSLPSPVTTLFTMVKDPKSQ